MKRRLAFALVTALAACGPVPQPFRRDDVVSPLVTDQRMLASILVRPVAAFPGLDAAMVKALGEQQDVIAFQGSADRTAIQLTASVVGGSLVWILTDPAGRGIGSETQKLDAGAHDPAELPAIAAKGAAMVAEALRGADLGASDLDSAPTIAVRNIEAPDKVEAALLTGSLTDALSGQGLRLDGNAPQAIVGGVLKVTPGSAGQDAVGIDWTVRDPSGAILGTVSQGNLVDDAQIKNHFADMAREIAAAAAPGLNDLIRNKVSSAPAAK